MFGALAVVVALGRLMPSFDVQLPVNSLEMAADGIYRNCEILGDFFVQFAIGQQLEHFLLPR